MVHLIWWTLFLSAVNAGEVHVNVKGMVCGFCAQGVVKKFSSEAAVGKADVSLDRQMITLDLKEGRELSDRRITELLEDAGFMAGEIVRR